MSRLPLPDRLAAELNRTLKAAGDPTRAEGEKRYLKSDLAFYGASLPAIRAAVREVKQEHPLLQRADLRKLVQELWERPAFECRITAVLLLEAFGEKLKATDIALIARMLRTSKTWAIVDELAGVVAGSLVERYPQLYATLDRLVYNWLKPRIGRASGVTVREAVRWLPSRQRDELVHAYHSSSRG